MDFKVELRVLGSAVVFMISATLRLAYSGTI
jgi:hypothetical protein